MKTFKELYKSYPGKGWLDDDEIPKIKPKDIVWRSQVHRWDSEVRSDNTRMIIVKEKGKFSMYAISDKSGEVLFHFGDNNPIRIRSFLENAEIPVRSLK